MYGDQWSGVYITQVYSERKGEEKDICEIILFIIYNND